MGRPVLDARPRPLAPLPAAPPPPLLPLAVVCARFASLLLFSSPARCFVPSTATDPPALASPFHCQCNEFMIPL